MFVFDDGTNSHCPPRSSNVNGVGQEENQSPSCRGQIDSVCSWKPVAILKKYKESPTDKRNQAMFWKHITNFVAARESVNDTKLAPPSAYLDVETSNAQIEMLKPTHKNVVMGNILKDSDGKDARQLIAKRRIDMIDGNIGSYSRLLNSTQRMEMIQDVNAALTAIVATISKDKADERTRMKETMADEKAKKREEKQKATESAEEARRNEMMPVLTGLMQPFETNRSDRNLDGVKAFSANVLRDILRFYFRVKKPK